MVPTSTNQDSTGDATFGKDMASASKTENEEVERLMKTTGRPTPAQLTRTRIPLVWQRRSKRGDFTAAALSSTIIKASTAATITKRGQSRG